MTFGLHHLFITGVLAACIGFALGIAHARALRNLRAIMHGEKASNASCVTGK